VSTYVQRAGKTVKMYACAICSVFWWKNQSETIFSIPIRKLDLTI